MATIITTDADTAAAIRARRRAVGLTQRQLAAAAGCSLTWLANIEAGCVPRQSEALQNIHAALETAERERRTGLSNEQRPGEDQGAAEVVRGDRDAAYKRT